MGVEIRDSRDPRKASVRFEIEDDDLEEIGRLMRTDPQWVNVFRTFVSGGDGRLDAEHLLSLRDAMAAASFARISRPTVEFIEMALNRFDYVYFAGD